MSNGTGDANSSWHSGGLETRENAAGYEASGCAYWEEYPAQHLSVAVVCAAFSGLGRLLSVTVKVCLRQALRLSIRQKNTTGSDSLCHNRNSYGCGWARSEEEALSRAETPGGEAPGFPRTAPQHRSQFSTVLLAHQRICGGLTFQSLSLTGIAEFVSPFLFTMCTPTQV